MADATPKYPTKDVKILCEKHTHKGRDYYKGAVIPGMRASSADWLIANKRAEEVRPGTNTTTRQEG